MQLPVNPTIAFWSMLESHGELRAFFFITQADVEKQFNDSNNPDHRGLLEMWRRGSAVANKLGVVYLVAVMEAYMNDLLMELLDKRIRRVNQDLLNQPAPTSEDDDIMNEINLEQAEMSKDNPFYMFSEISKEWVRNRTRQDTLRNSLKLLEKYFGREIQDRESHLKKWQVLKDLRNRIVHHKGYARKKTWPIVIKDDTETIDEISVDKTYLMAAVDDMHEFALAVESNITKSI